MFFEFFIFYFTIYPIYIYKFKSQKNFKKWWKFIYCIYLNPLNITMFDFGILWMNGRNLNYIKKYNSRSGVSLADNKLRTKKSLEALGVPFAQTYATIRNIDELKKFQFESIDAKEFVIKPNKGSKGRGILIVKRQEDNHFLVNSEVLSKENLSHHLRDILDGVYSISGFSDTVVFEELLRPHHDFVEFCRFWLADIRIIVFNSVPIAAMIRVPTKESGWKANLAQGGLGFGINISTWQVNSFLFEWRIYNSHFPLSYDEFENKQLPFWDNILQYSAKIQSSVWLGYLALDWVLTKNGPKLLEINARAGLEIQNITGIPLKSRLRRIENIKVDSYKKWISIAHSLFGGKSQTVVDTSNTLYLSQLGTIKSAGSRDFSFPVTVTINLSESVTRVSKNIWEAIGKSKWNISIDGSSIRFKEPEFDQNTFLSSKNEVSLGLKEVKNYIIKPIHRYQTIERYFDGSHYYQIKELDREINGCGKWLNLSYMLRPTNFIEEMHHFVEQKWDYNPQFEYTFPSEEEIEIIRNRLLKARENLEVLEKDNKMYQLFSEKLDELFAKLYLVVAYKKQDYILIDSYQKKLYWEIDDELFKLSQQKIKNYQPANKSSGILGKLLSPEEVFSKLQEGLITYGLPEVPIMYDEKNTSRISIISGRDASVHIKENALFYEKEMDSIIAHEIGIHLRRFVNGTKSGLRILKHGTGFYLEDEEWLAIYNSMRYLPEGYEKNEMYLKYYLVCIAHSYSFSELAKRIQDIFPEESLESVFQRCVRLKKWITDTSREHSLGTVYEKDRIYLQWYMKVKKWIEWGGYIENMLVGKIKISDIENLSTF